MKTKASEQFSFSATLTSAVAIASSVHLKLRPKKVITGNINLVLSFKYYIYTIK